MPRGINRWLVLHWLMKSVIWAAKITYAVIALWAYAIVILYGMKLAPIFLR